MKFFRFMGSDECCRLCLHHRLLQQVDWPELRYRSTSRGFTFGLGGVDRAVEASRWLKGVVTMQYLLVADVADDKMFHYCRGGYPDYRTDDPTSQIRYVDELYTTEYSLDDFKSYDFYICLGISNDNQLVVVHHADSKAFASMLLSNSIAERQLDYNTNIIKTPEANSIRTDLTEYQSICEGVKKVMESWNNISEKYSK